MLEKYNLLQMVPPERCMNEKLAAHGVQVATPSENNRDYISINDPDINLMLVYQNSRNLHN